MAEDNVHKVLDIFSYFDSKAGEVLLATNFVAVGARRQWRMSDLQEGIEEASRIGWVEAAPQGGWRLTEDGFREAAQHS
ncbi:hypothetical protein [Beijerinckia sp. L45]|uniref:hypothetical protein n=1 Tax=Beijerinckia sp. L45 TaxID=1641855 RepID=UPI00131D1B90|nr:hypothetical protein [Beijerinckia sp. L45]